MKNLLFMLSFFISMITFAQSSCACGTNSGTVQANCEQGSNCSCSSQDGACSCGCSAKSNNHLIQQANLKNVKIEDCGGVLNNKFILNNTNLIISKPNNLNVKSFELFKSKLNKAS